jgi:A/G-specific adenine glycosylase
MGYNNRAVRLHELGRIVVREFDGALPADHETLVRLPGVGRYTANAVLAFAFQRRVPVVETNIRRVLSRILFRFQRTSDLADLDEIWREALQLLPRKNSYNWNQALMELGATICTARAPKCSMCPVGNLCSSSGSLSSPKQGQKKNEPSFLGTPNRIYRGRVIEILRNTSNPGGIPLSRLGPALHPLFKPSHLGWLTSLVSTLERDGLVLIRGSESSIRRTLHLA